jgi:hypothetical protein
MMRPSRVRLTLDLFVAELVGCLVFIPTYFLFGAVGAIAAAIVTFCVSYYLASREG